MIIHFHSTKIDLTDFELCLKKSSWLKNLILLFAVDINFKVCLFSIDVNEKSYYT